MTSPIPWGLGTCPEKKRKPRKSGSLPLERDIQKAIQKAFRLQHRIGLVHVDAGMASVRSMASAIHSEVPIGYPDLIGVIPPLGRFLAIEVKRPGNKPTPAQLAMLDLLRSKGAIAFWADSVQSALDQFNAAMSGGPEAA